MKLRIKGNSIRLRLTQTEVAAVVAGRVVVERTAFPGNAVFLVSLSVSAKGAAVTTGFDGMELRVALPKSMATTWGTTDQIGITVVVPNGKPGGLTVLIEKDFACLEHREEDADAFPNPIACSLL